MDEFKLLAKSEKRLSLNLRHDSFGPQIKPVAKSPEIYIFSTFSRCYHHIALPESRFRPICKKQV